MNIFKEIVELLLLPLKIFLPENITRHLNITSRREARITEALKLCKGRTLDIGCGGNELIRRYGNGIGVDIKQWGDVDLVCNPTSLPFPDKYFDTITFIASLNHIYNRKKVLMEARRCLKKEGRIIITMINPIIGWFCHQAKWINWDLGGHGLKDHELPGMTKKMITDLLQETGFNLSFHRKFLYGLNNIYIADVRVKETD